MKGGAAEPFNAQLEVSISESDPLPSQIRRAWNPTTFYNNGQVMKGSVLTQIGKSRTLVS